MSNISPIPRKTSHAARAIFGSDNFYIVLGNRLAVILAEFEPRSFIAPRRAQKSAVPLLPLLTLFQYMESLTDGQTVEALHYRLDWNYALHLPLNQLRIPEETLCQYRHLNLHNDSYLSELQELLDCLAAVPTLDSYIKKPLDAECMIIVVCMLDRLARVEDAMHRAIESLTNHHPDWLRRITLPHWYTRYHHVSPYLEVSAASNQAGALAREIGEDARYLLECVDQSDTRELYAVEEIEKLRAVWQEQFKLTADASSMFLSRCASCPTILISEIQVSP